MRELVDPGLCASVERQLAPLWATTLMAPEIAAELQHIGLAASERYFASRVAPLGEVSSEVVVATFFNFSPAAVTPTIPAVWEKVTAEDLLAAQGAGIDQALARAFAELDRAIVKEALALARAAAEAAAARPEGRPLFAGYASLPWPDDDNTALWHAHYMLREFRGDGHIAVLVAEGLSGIEALAIHVALMPFLAPVFLPTRRWTDDEWGAALERLRADGWLTNDETLTLTESGRARRDAIEHRTNDLNTPAYAAIGNEGCERLLELGKPIAEAIETAGLSFPFRPN